MRFSHCSGSPDKASPARNVLLPNQPSRTVDARETEDHGARPALAEQPFRLQHHAAGFRRRFRRRRLVHRLAVALGVDAGAGDVDEPPPPLQRVQHVRQAVHEHRPHVGAGRPVETDGVDHFLGGRQRQQTIGIEDIAENGFEAEAPELLGEEGERVAAKTRRPAARRRAATRRPR